MVDIPHIFITVASASIGIAIGVYWGRWFNQRLSRFKKEYSTSISPTRLVLIASVSLFSLMPHLWNTYVASRHSVLIGDDNSLEIFLDVPDYLILGEHSDLNIIVVSVPSEARNAQLQFALISDLGLSGVTTVEVPIPNESRGIRRVAVYVPFVPAFFTGHSVTLSIETSVNDAKVGVPFERRIPIAPIPFLITMISFLSGAAILASSAVLLFYPSRLRLLYWAFFNTSGLRSYFHRNAPELAGTKTRIRRIWDALRENSALRDLLLDTLAITILILTDSVVMPVTAPGSANQEIV